MKSLISASDSAANQRITSWLPTDFNAETPPPTEENKTIIEGIFQPDPSTVLWYSFTKSHLIKSGQPLAFDSWKPQEFKEIPANRPQSWEGVSGPEGANDWSKSFSGIGAEAQQLVINARNQAEEILSQTQETSAKMIAEAQAQVSEIENQAYQQGWERARQEAVPFFQSLNSIVEQANSWQENLFAQANPFVSNMIIEIAEMMFGEGVVLDDQALQTNLNRILENTRALGDLKIFLNPQDAAILDPSWRENQSVISGNRVQIIPAEGITRGGCFIQGTMGAVDARVETQLESILGSLQSKDEE